MSPNGPILRPLLTPHERGVEPLLRDVTERHGFRVDAQVKLSHVVDRCPPGITWTQWDYATRAELDFLVSDAETTWPEFAVELDDASHRTREARRRDAMKDAVCEAAGLELLRVEASAFAPAARGRVLVDYLIDARDYQRAFNAAQEAGHLPYDEPGDFRSVLSLEPGAGIDFVNDLAMPARLAAQAAWKANRVLSPVVRSTSVYGLDGWADAFAWLRVTDDRYLYRPARLRRYHFACGIGPAELAEDLAVASIGDDLAALARGDAVLVSRRSLTRHVRGVLDRADDVEPWSLTLFRQETADLLT